MPWCPHCDEVFPQGPACPRCRAALVDVTGGGRGEEIQSSIALPRLKVPRRIRRAFGRPAEAPPPSKQLVAFALSLVLIAGGFALGRMSSTPVDAPIVRPQTGPVLGIPSVRGSLSFVGRVHGPRGAAAADLALVRISLRTGAAEHSARFSSPLGGWTGREQTRLAAFGEGTAIMISSTHGDALVGAFPADRPPVHWIDGAEAAWESGTTLLVRSGSSVRRWVLSEEGVDAEPVPGSWAALHQAPDGAVLEGRDDQGPFLAVLTENGTAARATTIPGSADVIAAGPRGAHSLVRADGRLAVWDGRRLEPSLLDPGYVVLGASFTSDGEQVALTVADSRPGSNARDVLLAVIDATGSPKGMRRLTTIEDDRACAAVPAWDREGSWVFVAVGDGSVYAVDLTGASVRELLSGQSVGCGVAWGSGG